MSRPLEVQAPPVSVAGPESSAAGPGDTEVPSVVVARTQHGWSVVSVCGSQPVQDVLEGMVLADLVAEELDAVPEIDPRQRKAARGPVDAAEHAGADPVARELAGLRRTVSQLEHALATRVVTERAIGVLAERHGQSPRDAFEGLRREARSGGRPVHELARAVLEDLTGGRPDTPGAPPVSPAGVPGSEAPAPRMPRPQERAALHSVAPAPARPSDEAAARSGRDRRVSRSDRHGMPTPTERHP